MAKTAHFFELLQTKTCSQGLDQGCRANSHRGPDQQGQTLCRPPNQRCSKVQGTEVGKWASCPRKLADQGRPGLSCPSSLCEALPSSSPHARAQPAGELSGRAPPAGPHGRTPCQPQQAAPRPFQLPQPWKKGPKELCRFLPEWLWTYLLYISDLGGRKIRLWSNQAHLEESVLRPQGAPLVFTDHRPSRASFVSTQGRTPWGSSGRAVGMLCPL